MFKSGKYLTCVALALVVVLAACAAPAPTPVPPPPPTTAPAQPTVAAPTSAPAATAVAKPTSAPTIAAPPTTAPTAAPTTAAAKPQTPVVIVQGVDPPTLDVQFVETGALANVALQMFDTLLEYDKNMNIVPSVAESYKLLDDQITWQFKIRKGIKFWDGEVLDANAVKFTFDRMMDADLRKQGLNDPFPGRVGFDHCVVVDDYTINFVLKKPSVLFPVYITFPYLLAPDYYRKNPPSVTAIKPMGSGPWMFKEWVKDDHITLVANPSYYLGKPQIDTVIIKPVPQISTRLAMLEAGEADIAADLTPEDVARVQAKSNLRVSQVSSSGRRVGIVLPTNIPLFKDRRIRLAMNYAVDFDAINKSILGGLAQGQMEVPVNGKFWLNPNIKPYGYNPDKAKQLLQEASWNPNTQVTLYSTDGRYLKDKEMTQAIAGMLTKVGMKAQAQTLEYSVFSDKNSKSLFDMPFMIGLGSRSFGPEDLSIHFEKGFQGYEWQTETEKGPAARKLFDQLTSTFDEKKQQELVFQIEQMFYDEAAWIPLWRQVSLFGVNKRIDWEGSGNTRIDLWIISSPDVHFTGQ